MRGFSVSDALRLAVSLALTLAAGFVGSIFTRKSVGAWYPTLKKPAFTPPAAVFGPVWTVLYLAMGLALFLVWRRWAADSRVRPALALFSIQLVLNVLWSAAFFGARSPLAAAVVIVVLWAVILWTVLAFARISHLAAGLLVPYIAWVSFAAILNFTIYFLNR